MESPKGWMSVAAVAVTVRPNAWTSLPCECSFISKCGDTTINLWFCERRRRGRSIRLRFSANAYRYRSQGMSDQTFTISALTGISTGRTGSRCRRGHGLCPSRSSLCRRSSHFSQPARMWIWDSARADWRMQVGGGGGGGGETGQPLPIPVSSTDDTPESTDVFGCRSKACESAVPTAGLSGSNPGVE